MPRIFNPIFHELQILSQFEFYNIPCEKVTRVELTKYLNFELSNDVFLFGIQIFKITTRDKALIRNRLARMDFIVTF